MAFLRYIYLTFFSLLLVLSSLYQPTSSQAFSSALIRTSSHQTSSSPLPILVSVIPEENAVEDSLTITIPSDYVFSSQASDYTVSTALLPSDYQSMPGISTATSVAGDQVTFPIGDIVVGVRYGFFITGGITSTPSSVSSAESVWTVASYGSGTEIEASSVTVPVVANNGVSVTASVGPSVSHFEADLSAAKTGALSENTQRQYTLNYHSHYPGGGPVTLRAQWSRGTIGSQSVASVDVTQYVAGSATNATGGTEPVIDPTNRTITWEIPNLTPVDGEQTVSFSLKTTSNYTGGESVSFTVSGGIIEPVVTVPSEIEQQYRYSKQISNQNQSNSDSDDSEEDDSTTDQTTAVVPCTTDCPAPVATTSLPQLQSVSISRITDEEVQMMIQLSSQGSLVVNYGESRANLFNQVDSENQELFHFITLSNLQKSTTYYFRIKIISEDGSTTQSDLYAVKTASQPPAQISGVPVSITSNGIPLALNTLSQGFNYVVIPQNQKYTFSLSFPKDLIIKSAQTSLVYESVGAISAASQKAMVPLKDSLFVTTLDMVEAIGDYQLQVQIEDFFGNRQTFDVGTLRVVKPLMIFSKENGFGVENARVEISRYSELTQLYEVYDASSFGINDAWKTDETGVVPIVLTEGKYRLLVIAPTFIPKEVIFELNQNQAYPIVWLEPDHKNFWGRIPYHYLTLTTFAEKITDEITLQSKSYSFYIVGVWFSLLLLSVGLVISLSVKTHLPLRLLPHYLYHRFLVVSGRYKNKNVFHGKFVDSESGKPLSGIKVTAFDPKNAVVADSVTASDGRFTMKVNTKVRTVQAEKLGLHPVEYVLPESNVGQGWLLKYPQENKVIESQLEGILKVISGSIFEVTLLVNLLLQLLFIDEFGLFRMIPFLLVSVVNIILWTLYLSLHWMQSSYIDAEVIAK